MNVIRSHVLNEATGRDGCEWCHGEGCDDCRVITTTGVMLELESGDRVKFSTSGHFYFIPIDGWEGDPLSYAEAHNELGEHTFRSVFLAIIEAEPSLGELFQ